MATSCSATSSRTPGNGNRRTADPDPDPGVAPGIGGTVEGHRWGGPPAPGGPRSPAATRLPSCHPGPRGGPDRGVQGALALGWPAAGALRPGAPGPAICGGRRGGAVGADRARVLRRRARAPARGAAGGVGAGTVQGFHRRRHPGDGGPRHGRRLHPTDHRHPRRPGPGWAAGGRPGVRHAGPAGGPHRGGSAAGRGAGCNPDRDQQPRPGPDAHGPIHHRSPSRPDPRRPHGGQRERHPQPAGGGGASVAARGCRPGGGGLAQSARPGGESPGAPGMTHIKICGNTEPDGVRLAVSLGVDLLGFIFTRSPRRVTIEQAQALIAGVSEHIGRVGVFIDEPVEEIARTVEACELSAVQLYRTPTAADRQLPVPLLPVVRLRTAEDATELQFGPTDRPLLDTYLPDVIGGTGRTWDWTLAESLVGRYPVIISGGLRPENVGAVIRQLRPWGVDVASGVELSPGVKDLARLEWFVRTVRQSDSAAAQRAAG